MVRRENSRRALPGLAQDFARNTLRPGSDDSETFLAPRGLNSGPIEAGSLTVRVGRRCGGTPPLTMGDNGSPSLDNKLAARGSIQRAANWARGKNVVTAFFPRLLESLGVERRTSFRQ